MTTPEIVDQIHKIILEDCWISANSIAEQLDISQEQVVHIIHEDFDMQKFSMKWVLKCLNVDEKRLSNFRNFLAIHHPHGFLS